MISIIRAERKGGYKIDFKEAIAKSQEYYENFITRSVHNSNKIEGSTLSYVETYAIIFNDNAFSLSDIKPREIYEAINLKYALQQSLKILEKQENEMNSSFIIELNEIINKNIKDTTGYRKIAVYIRGSDFVPPEPSEVPGLKMEKLYLYHNDDHSLMHILKILHKKHSLRGR